MDNHSVSRGWRLDFSSSDGEKNKLRWGAHHPAASSSFIHSTHPYSDTYYERRRGKRGACRSESRHQRFRLTPRRWQGWMSDTTRAVWDRSTLLEKWLTCDVMKLNCDAVCFPFFFFFSSGGLSIWSKVTVSHWQRGYNANNQIIQLRLPLIQSKLIKICFRMTRFESSTRFFTKSQPKAAESRKKHWVFVKNNAFDGQKGSSRQHGRLPLTRLIFIFSDVVPICGLYQTSSLQKNVQCGSRRCFLISKKQVSVAPCFRSSLSSEGGGNWVGLKRGKKRKRGMKVKRVQRGSCYCPGDAWQHIGGPQSWLWYRLTRRARGGAKGRAGQCGAGRRA